MTPTDDTNAPDTQAPPPITRVGAVFRWIYLWALRVMGYWALGLGAMIAAFPIGLTMATYGLIDDNAPISVIRSRPLIPFMPPELSIFAEPIAVQMSLLTALVVWLVLTSSWRERPEGEEPGRAAPPLLMAVLLGWASTTAWHVDLSIATSPFAVFLYSFQGLPFIILATAMWLRRRERAGAVVIKWGVALSLLAATQPLNARATPHVGATLSERDAWARRHMGAPYTLTSRDLANATILRSVMGEDLRVGPTTPQHGWLQLGLDDEARLRGWISVDDGERAAKCFVEDVYTREGSLEKSEDVVCRRNGLRITFDPRAETRYELEAIEAADEHTLTKGYQDILARFPTQSELWGDLVRSAHPSFDLATQRQVFHRVFARGERDHVMFYMFFGVEHDARTVSCRGSFYFTHDGARLTGDALSAVVEDAEAPSCRLLGE